MLCHAYLLRYIDLACMLDSYVEHILSIKMDNVLSTVTHGITICIYMNIHGGRSPVLSTMHLRNMVLFLVYEGLLSPERSANLGQPEAIFMSALGLQNDEDVGSGQKLCTMSFSLS